MRGILLCALALSSSPALAGTFHVAPTGSDTAAGTAAAPWRTPQRAATAVQPGDTVVIHAGTYAGFTVTARGTAAAPIAFIADGDARIDGTLGAGRDAILIEGGAWIRLEGLHVSGATRAGIAALDCHHVTVRGSRIDDNGTWGVFTAFCDDILVEDNEISRSARQHGVYASNSADRPVIRRNKIWGNGMCGIHMNGDINFGGDGVISGAVVEANVITDNGELGGSGINGDGVTDAVIRNNVLDDNHASGVSLYRIDGGAASVRNQVINNTIRMASDARWAINLQDGATGNVLRNNILLNAASSRGAIDACTTCTTGLVSEHNAVVGRFSIGGTVIDLATWRARTGADATSQVATAAELFTDPAAGDLTLRAGSPAIDQATSEGAPATDVLATARPQGAAIDIGAYEWCAGGCVPPDGGDGGGDDGAGGGDDAGPGTGSGDDAGTGDEPGEPRSGPAADGEAGGCQAGAGGGLLGAAVVLGLAALARRRSRVRA